MVAASTIAAILRRVSRGRRIVLILLVVLLIPVLAILGVGGVLSQGGLEGQIGRHWRARGLPGELSATRVRFTGLDEVILEGLSLAEPGQAPLVTAERAVARINLVEGRLDAIRFEGVQGELDADRLAFLHAIIEAEQRHPPQGRPTPVVVEVAGTARLPGGLTLADVRVRVHATGAEAIAEAVATCSGRPVQLTVTTHRERSGGPILTTVAIAKAELETVGALDAAGGLFPIISVGTEVRARLPSTIEAAGTTVIVDPANDAAQAAIRLSWQGGMASAELAVDRRQIQLRKLDVQDGRLGSCQGVVQIDRKARTVACDATSWSLQAAALPIPARVPVAEISRHLSILSVRHPVANGRTQVVLLGQGNARVEALVGGDAPPRLSGANIPLALVQPFLPEPLVLAGGQVESLTATIHADRPELEARLGQARLIASGWSFGPLDGRLAAVVLPGGGVQVSAVLPRAGATGQDAPMGTISFSGTAERGTLSVDCAAVESLLTRLRGPSPLPDLRGGVQLAVSYVRAGQGIDLRLDKATLAGVEMRLAGAEFVRSVDSVLRGDVQVRPRLITVRAGGQLRRGQLRVAGTWIDVAAQQPICTTEVQVALGEGGETRAVTLVEALVRAADAAGEPLSGGYSAQFSGGLSGAPLSGSIEGVLDHADLRWLTGIAGLTEARIVGEGAVAVSARLGGGGIEHLSGTFLPLGVDLGMVGGKLRIHGISGGIRFDVGQE